VQPARREIIRFEAREGDTMKSLLKTTLFGAAACALAAPAFAYTINGTIPPHAPPQPVTIALHQPIGPGILKLTFTAPPVNAGVRYVISFCIGPAAHPCVLPLSVLEGQQAVVPVDANLFTVEHDVISVGQGTKVAVPYTLEVDTLP
jgi:hypothetical protein